MKKILIFLLLLLAGCDSEHHSPTFLYNAQFDVKKVSSVERYSKDLANARGYRLFEKSKEEMKAITGGRDAFFIAYYNGGELPILSISNAGPGIVLSLMISTNDNFNIDEATELASIFKKDLKEMLDIDLQPKQSLN